MANKNQAPSAFLRKVDKLEAGTTKNVVGKATVTVAGTAMTGPQINAKLGTADTLYSAVVEARAAETQALSAYNAALPELREFVKDYEFALKGTFGSKSAILVDFGIAPARPAARTVESKAKAVARGKQTRAVRGTKGKVQRQAVTVEGTPGLALVTPGGQLVGGVLDGPIPPGGSEPAAVQAGLPVTGAPPAAPEQGPTGK